MRWLHFIEVDDRMSPRRGLFIERYDGKVVALTLVLAVTTPWRRWHQVDFKNGMVRTKTDYWMRLTLTKQIWRGVGRRISAAWGSGPTDTIPLAWTSKTAAIYEEAK